MDIYKANLHDYDNIIKLPHPTSKKHPRMSPHDRAAQFSAFAALNGHSDAIDETARYVEAKQELSEEDIAKLNRTLELLKKSIASKPEITVTYFVADGLKDGGIYTTEKTALKRIDDFSAEIILQDGKTISVSDILRINTHF